MLLRQETVYFSVEVNLSIVACAHNKDDNKLKKTTDDDWGALTYVCWARESLN